LSMTGPVQGHFGVKLQADAELPTERFSLGLARGANRVGDLSESCVTGEQVAILHLPQLPGAIAKLLGVAELMAKIGGTVDLPLGRLPGLAVDFGEVVAVDRAGPARDRAGRALRLVLFVDAHTLLRGDRGAHHLQQIELRRNLKQRVRVGRVGMQGTDIADHFAQGGGAGAAWQLGGGCAQRGELRGL